MAVNLLLTLQQIVSSPFYRDQFPRTVLIEINQKLPVWCQHEFRPLSALTGHQSAACFAIHSGPIRAILSPHRRLGRKIFYQLLTSSTVLRLPFQAILPEAADFFHTSLRPYHFLDDSPTLATHYFRNAYALRRALILARIPTSSCASFDHFAATAGSSRGTSSFSSRYWS